VKIEKSKNSIAGVKKDISRLILGTAAYDNREKEKWFAVLDTYKKLGGNAIDTARAYGESEAVIGSWIKSRRVKREEIVIISKGWHILDKKGRPDFRTEIRAELDKSLETLGTDYIDLYLLHRDTPWLPVQEIIDTLNEEISAGRIHAFGLCNCECRRLQDGNRYAARHNLIGFAAASNNLSLALPSAPFYEGLKSTDKNDEKWHAKHRMPLIAWSSQARGFFTGRYTPRMRDKMDTIEDGFTRRMLEVYGTDENFERLKRARRLARKKGRFTATQIVLAWALHRSYPLFPIIGPRTTGELHSCKRALSIKLTRAETRWLNLER